MVHLRIFHLAGREPTFSSCQPRWSRLYSITCSRATSLSKMIKDAYSKRHAHKVSKTIEIRRHYVLTVTYIMLRLVTALEAEDLASDLVAQPNSGPELCSVPSHPMLSIPAHKPCLAAVAARAVPDRGPAPSESF